MPVQAEEYSVPMDPVLFEWNGRPVSGFRFCTGNASGERFSVGGSLQPVFPFDGGMRTVAIGLVAGVSAAAEHYPVPNFEGSAVFALDADPAAYPESSAGADRRVFDQSQAGFEDEFVGFSRAVVPGGQAGARTHRSFADGQLAGLRIAGCGRQVPDTPVRMAETGENTVFFVVVQCHPLSLGDLYFVHNPVLSGGDRRIPFLLEVRAVAIGFAAG